MEKKSLKLNFIMNAILTMSSILFPLITFPYISRILLPEGTGKVNLAASVIAYFNMFAQLGIPTYGIKACAKVRDNREQLTKTVHELAFINIIMSAIAYIALAIVIATVPRIREEKTLYIIYSITIILSAIGMEWLYQSLEEYSYITKRSLLFKAIAVVAMFLLVREQEDYVIYAAITVFATGASNVTNFINSRKYIDFKWQRGYDLQRHVKVILIFFALACTTTIYTNLDNVMLGFMTTNVEVGLYSAAIKIKTVLISLITSLGVVLLPRASYYVEENNEEEFVRITKKALHFVIVLAIPIVLYFILYADECIIFVAGEAFSDAAMSMRIIMPTVLFVGITNLLGLEIMVPTGRERTVLYSTITGAVIDIIVNALLIPRYGAAGAAAGTLAAESGVLIFQIVALRKDMNKYLKEIEWWKVLVALVPAIAVAVIIKKADYGIFKTLIYSAGLFFAVYGTVLIVLRENLVYHVAESFCQSKLLRRENVKKYLIIAYSVCIAVILLSCTQVAKEYPVFNEVLTIIRFACHAVALCIILYNYITGSYSKKTLLIIGVVTVIICIVTYTSRVLNPLMYWIFVVAAVNLDLEDITKWFCLIHFSILAIVILATLSGIIGIEDVVYDMGGRIRECLGFNWTTYSSNFMLYAIIAWMYWRKNHAKWWEYIAISIAVVFLYVRTDTKSAFSISLTALIISLVLKYATWLRNYKKGYKIIALSVLIVCVSFIIGITLFGDIDSEIVQKINVLVNERIKLGMSAVDTYGITLFGQQITWVGGDGLLPDGTYGYNYVDSSYVQILLNFGVVFLAMIIVYLVAIIVAGSKKKDTYLLIALCLIIAHTTFDPQLIWMEYDVFMMVFGVILSVMQNNSDSKGKKLLAQQR